MYKVITIFTLIFVSLQRGRSDNLQNTECCYESVLLNISLPNCADIRCSSFSKNPTDNGRTYSPLNDEGTSSRPDERPSEHTPTYDGVNSPSASVSTNPPKCPSYLFNSHFYRYNDQFIKFDANYLSCFHFSPYYECKVVPSSKTTGNLHIKCPRKNNTTERCPPGNLIFEKDEEIGHFWECTLKEEEMEFVDYLYKVDRRQEPHILLHNTFYQNNDNTSNGSIEDPYIIVHSTKSYDIKHNYMFNFGDLQFKQKFNCSDEQIKENNTRNDEGLVCRKIPLYFPLQKAYVLLRCSCIFFSSATLLMFILLPPMRTMKTAIIFCQALSYLVRDLVALPHDLGVRQLTYIECIAVAYNQHYWDLAASFWTNIMSIDLALTFRGRGFSRGKSRTTFLLYSLYGWGGPLIITLVTVILGFWVTLSSKYSTPDINLEICWFHTKKASLMYHYVPAMVLSAINIPLLCYTVYNIIKSVCTSDVLYNEDSARHVGNKVKKESRTRLVIYFNLALLIGSPKPLQFIKLFIYRNDTIEYALNTTGLLRVIFMFLFVTCKKRVFKLLKERLLLENFSLSSVFTTLSSKSNDINSPNASSPVLEESTQL